MNSLPCSVLTPHAPNAAKQAAASSTKCILTFRRKGHGAVQAARTLHANSLSARYVRAALESQHSAFIPCSIPALSRPAKRKQSKKERRIAAAAVELVQAGTQTPWSAVAGLLEVPGLRDSCAFVLALGAAAGLVKFFNFLAAKDYMDRKLSRKMVHLLAGPGFVLTWPLFSGLPQARYVAVAVPFLNFVRLAAIGMGWIQDPATVKAVSREGDRTELLRGPLYYTLVLVATTLVYWRDSLTGMVTISMLCGGDGLADIVGRHLGSAKLPWNPNKSWAGSLAMFSGGLAMSLGYISLFKRLGYFSVQMPLVPVVAFIAALATLVESLPINKYIDDNISVPLTTALAGFLLMESVIIYI